jgi:imidazolonepropionase-like amidohydrolase
VKKYIIAKTLIDGKSSTQLKDQVIVVKDDKIEAITPLGSINNSEMNPDSTYEINHILPGLIDCHNHLSTDIGDQEEQLRQHITYISLRIARNARKDLLSGITTMRTCGEKGEMDFAHRRAIKEWIVPGPRILASGAPIGITGSHVWTFLTEQVDGPEAMRDAVRRRRRAGADFIKLMVSGGMMTPGSDYMMAEITLEELKAAVNEANRWGKRTAAHIHGGQGLDFAIEAGVTTIEHGGFATEEQLVNLAKSGQYLVATIHDIKVYADEGDKYGVPIYAQEKSKAGFEIACKTMSKARQLGVKIAIGQDCNHGNLVLDMIDLVKCANFPVMDAIKSATAMGAETCELEKVTGTIEVGKFADIIGVDNNPVDDIAALQKVSFVMKEGVLCLYNGKVLV